MFIYADESGNTGRALFNEPDEYHLGSILSVADPEAILHGEITSFASQLGVERIHANELRVEQNVSLANRVMELLDGAGPWSFDVTTIEKSYIATTKFVDMIFDSGENEAVPWMWYNFELFRHAICLAVDEMLTERNRQNFWQGLLDGDVVALKDCVRNALTYLPRVTDDKRLLEVIRDSCTFFLKHTDLFSISGPKGKRGYQTHTPNMVAFSCLMRNVHTFAEKHNSPPIAFIHDRQDEFRKTMREWQKVFGPIAFDDHDKGGPPAVRVVAHTLPELEIVASKDSSALQAVDNLLWISRRRSGEAVLEQCRKRLFDNSDTYFITKWMSEMIVAARMQQSMRADLSVEDLERAAEMRDNAEATRIARMRSPTARR